jgi:hypothetical protein
MASSSAPITVRIDNGVRLAGALLAASEWPDYEQTVKPYKPHRVAEHAHKHFASHSGHPAVMAARALVGDGSGLATLFTHALNANWPADMTASLADFQAIARPDEFWAETQADWAQAESDGREVAARADLRQFLTDLFGPLSREITLAPNLLFPGLLSITLQTATEVALIQPPPKAWGASPPWRYNERPDEVEAALAEAYARHLFETRLPADQTALKPHAGVFALAAAVLFLRQAEGDAAGDQFMMMEKRTRNLPKLPAVVMALEPLLADRRAGKYANFADYVPQLAGHFA